MNLVKPLLMIGVGGVGTTIAMKAKECINSDCLLISHDQNDLCHNNIIKIPVDSIINPSSDVIKKNTYKISDEIYEKIKEYSTIVLIINLAGKSGIGISPIISQIMKKCNKKIISFVIMPFKFEKEILFKCGVTLDWIKYNSNCTIIFDNNALLDSNIDVTIKECYEIANETIEKIIMLLKTSVLNNGTNIVTTSKHYDDVENSFKNALKMLYKNIDPNNVKNALIHIFDDGSMKLQILNSISKTIDNIFRYSNMKINYSTNSDKKSTLIISSITEYNNDLHQYDPLKSIPKENTIDHDEVDCGVDCSLNLYQLE